MLASLNPFIGVAHMLSQPFLRYAFVAGGAIALASGLVGYFVVLRSQVFTGDALSHVAFTGTLAALAAGVGLLLGLYVACVVVAVAMALLGQRGRADDTVIGTVFAWVLGLGVLFLTIYTTSPRGASGVTGPNVLFGTIFGLSAGQTLTDTLVCLGVGLAMVVIGRPLLFSSVDDSVASAADYRFACSVSCFSVLSESPPPPPPKRLVPCCCSGCSPLPPAPPSASPRDLM